MIAATQKDFDAVCEITARAFEDDPVVGWLLRSDHRRADAFRTFFRTLARTTYFPHGEVYINEGRTGATMWQLSEDRQDPGTLELLLQAPTIIRICGWRGIPRLLRVQSVLDTKRPEQRHIYLFSIGTLPEMRGQGIGSALMEPMTRRLDEQQIPAFLENSREANLPFYMRHGFEVLEHIRLPDEGPPMWLMWREPR